MRIQRPRVRPCCCTVYHRLYTSSDRGTAAAGVGDSPLYNTADYNHSNTDNDAGIMSENTQTNNRPYNRYQWTGGLAHWVGRLTSKLPAVGSNPIKGSSCFLEQETLHMMLMRTGWFKERIREWSNNRTKSSWGPYKRLTYLTCPSGVMSSCVRLQGPIVSWIPVLMIFSGLDDTTRYINNEFTNSTTATISSKYLLESEITTAPVIAWFL